MLSRLRASRRIRASRYRYENQPTLVLRFDFDTYYRLHRWPALDLRLNTSIHSCPGAEGARHGPNVNQCTLTKSAGWPLANVR